VSSPEFIVLPVTVAAEHQKVLSLVDITDEGVKAVRTDSWLVADLDVFVITAPLTGCRPLSLYYSTCSGSNEGKGGRLPVLVNTLRLS